MSDPPSVHHTFQLSPSGSVPLHLVVYESVPTAFGNASVPSVLSHCFKYILSHPHHEGIFRVNGSVKRINIIYEHLSNNGALSTCSLFTIHDVCGVVKKYLRTYLPTMNNFFTPQFVASCQRCYDSYVLQSRRDSVDSYETASSSVDPATPQKATSEKESPADQLVSSFVDLMLANSHFKNCLFLYIVGCLHQLVAVEKVTKMSAANYSIVFQPYMFASENISHLPFLQELLSALITNYPLLAQTYLKRHIPDCVSPFSEVTVSTSPKRKSVSNRMSAFFDNYYIPVSKKRLSFNLNSFDKKLNKSTELLIDTANGNLDPQILPKSRSLSAKLEDHGFTSDYLNSKQSLIDSRQNSLCSYKESSRNSSIAKSENSICKSNDSLMTDTKTSIGLPSTKNFKSSDDVSDMEIVSKKKSRRKSFFGLFKNSSSVSVNSKSSKRQSIDQSHYNQLNKSIDNVLIANSETPAVLTRNLSLSLKSKQY